MAAEVAEVVVQPLLYRVEQAATMLGLDVRTIYALVAAGRLERRYVGSRNYRIPHESLVAYAESLPTEPH